jgi:hypothetical protein
MAFPPHSLFVFSPKRIQSPPHSRPVGPPTINFQQPSGCRRRDLDSIVADVDRLFRRIHRRSLKVGVNTATSSALIAFITCLCNFVFDRIIRASTSRILSRQTIVSPDVASRSPELGGCTNRRGQSSGLRGNIVDFLASGSGIGASVSTRTRPLMVAEANLFSRADSCSARHAASRA